MPLIRTGKAGERGVSPFRASEFQLVEGGGWRRGQDAVTVENNIGAGDRFSDH